MLGLAALAIPGIGPIVAAGPVVAALTGAGLGATAGGLIGGLANMGVPSDHARQYQEAVRRGGTLVVAEVRGADTARVESILNRHGAIDVEDRPAAATPASNLATGRSNVRFYDPEQSVAPDLADSRLRDVYNAEWRDRYSWEDFSDAWRFGHSLATTSPRAGDWSQVEPDARRHWERVHQRSWSKASDVVRRAWEHVQGRR
jgi:hypothetical protein